MVVSKHLRGIVQPTLLLCLSILGPHLKTHLQRVLLHKEENLLRFPINSFTRSRFDVESPDHSRKNETHFCPCQFLANTIPSAKTKRLNGREVVVEEFCWTVGGGKPAVRNERIGFVKVARGVRYLDGLDGNVGLACKSVRSLPIRGLMPLLICYKQCWTTEEENGQ